MPLLDEVGAYLIAQGVGVAGSTAAWVVTKNFEPPQPDKVISLFETGGFPNDGNTGALIDRPTFQARVRGPKGLSSSTARVKLAAARTSLELANNTTLSSRYFVHIQAQGEAMFLGHDENSRPRLVINFTALRSRTT